MQKLQSTFKRGDNGFYNTRQNMIKQNKKEFFTKEHHKKIKTETQHKSLES